MLAFARDCTLGRAKIWKSKISCPFIGIFVMLWVALYRQGRIKKLANYFLATLKMI